MQHVKDLGSTYKRRVGHREFRSGVGNKELDEYAISEKFALATLYRSRLLVILPNKFIKDLLYGEADMRLAQKLVLGLTLLALAIYLSYAPPLQAQGLTGQVGGSLRDASGAVLANATISLESSESHQQRTTTTDADGNFVFTELLPGTYNVSVAAPGFKSFRQEGLILTATQRLVLRPITLEVGSTTDQIAVSGDITSVETQSSERSGLISSKQIAELPTIGRNFLSLLSLTPGVIQTNSFDSPAGGDLGGVTINGSRGQSISLMLDGVPTMDTGNQSGTPQIPSLESIGEIKILTSNYQAEYGRSYGGLILVTTKAGTASFHGGAYYFVRNEALNANNFFNKRSGTARPRYRYNFPGYYIGGPVQIPKLLPKQDKLYFFFAQEFLPVTSPNSLVRGTVPSLLERQGDFSQTVDTNGAVIPIIDPQTGAQFPGNIIPSERFSSAGQALLNYFPQPNATDPNHTFNEVLQSTQNSPYRFETLRLDYALNNSNQLYVRGNNNRNSTSGLQTWSGDSGWPHLYVTANSPADGLAGTWLHTFAPTLVNELTIGVSHFKQFQQVSQESASSNNRIHAGVTIPQFNPQNNLYNLLPNTNFGGVQNPLNISYESRFPFTGSNSDMVYSDNLSKVHGAHNLKAGVYIEHTARNGTAWSPLNSFNGLVDFSRNSNNPYDTNYAYSNALIGSVNSYTESNRRPVAVDRYTDAEWFIQDNWRATKRLTLDLGLRFYFIGPTNQGNGQLLAGFVPSTFNAAVAPKLIQPRNDASGQRVGYNPSTGQFVPAVLIGSLAPGSGHFFEGMQTFKGHIMKSSGVHTLPRLGFAYDVFGDGRTAVRGGFGMFPGRVADDRGGDFLSEPPVQQQVNVYQTTISQLAASPQITSPNSVLGIQSVLTPPVTYNFSLGVQQDIGFKTVISAAYVGGLSRHLLQQQNLNGVPYGAQFTPAGADPSLPGQYLPLDFLRPLSGFEDVLYETFSGTANYNSLQVSATRRYSSNLTYGLAWTWSKAMDLTDGDQSNVLNPFINPRLRNYGKAGFDRTHDVVVNFDYRIPGLGSNWAERSVLGGWETSGIVSFVSGTPQGINYSETSTTNITGGGGSGVDSRVDIIGDPNLSRGNRTNSRAFNTAALAMPPAGTFGIGNARKDVFRGPGIENTDMTLMKNIPLGRDASRQLQLRLESYNIFNHAQFTSVDTNARFDASGQQVNADFGAYTAAGNPRRLQLGAKFSF